MQDTVSYIVHSFLLRGEQELSPATQNKILPQITCRAEAELPISYHEIIYENFKHNNIQAQKTSIDSASFLYMH